MPSLTPILYLNGRYLTEREAYLKLYDRAAFFADAIYEVLWIEKGQLIDYEAHLERFKRSAAAVKISLSRDDDILRFILDELIRRNHCVDGGLYFHASRGVMARDHLPRPLLEASMIAFVRPMDLASRMMNGQSVQLVKDIRWQRCDIKSVGLLPNVLARMEASENKNHEAWFVDEQQCITEGAASNAFIVDKKGCLRTHGAGCKILSGVVRAFVLSYAQKENIKFEEKAFTRDEIFEAQEVFLTGTLQGIMPVLSCDGKKTSPQNTLTSRLQNAYDAHMKKQMSS